MFSFAIYRSRRAKKFWFPLIGAYSTGLMYYYCCGRFTGRSSIDFEDIGGVFLG